MEDNLQSRVCSKCGIEKPITDYEFHTQRGRYRKECRDCVNARTKARYQANNEVRINSRSNSLKRKYGITHEDYELMFEEQKGLCLICGNPQSNSYYEYLCVDHDHATGKVRGLLCTKCNSQLGWFEINRNKIADYLDEEFLRSMDSYQKPLKD